MWSIILGLALLINSCEKEKNDPQPNILGHGGMALSPERAIYPDNSMASIDYALNGLNADGVEVDVQMTSDSVLVLYHNNFIELQNGELTCINNLSWGMIADLNKNRSHPILELETLKSTMTNEEHFLFLDLKIYNACNDSLVQLQTMADKVMAVFSDWSDEQRQRIVVNARNMDLIQLFPTDFCKRSFETEKVELAIEHYESGEIDLINTKLPEFTEIENQLLNEAELPLCLFFIKTRKEIEEAAAFLPDYLITDNIPATRKIYN